MTILGMHEEYTCYLNARYVSGEWSSGDTYTYNDVQRYAWARGILGFGPAGRPAGTRDGLDLAGAAPVLLARSPIHCVSVHVPFREEMHGNDQSRWMQLPTNVHAPALASSHAVMEGAPFVRLAHHTDWLNNHELPCDILCDKQSKLFEKKTIRELRRINIVGCFSVPVIAAVHSTPVASDYSFLLCDEKGQIPILSSKPSWKYLYKNWKMGRNS